MQRIQGNLVPMRNFTLIEIALGNSVPGQGDIIGFGNQNSLLDNNIITAMEVYDITLQTKAPSGNAVVSAAALTGLGLTLADTTNGKNFQWLENYPLSGLVTGNNAGIIKEVLFRYVTLNKSGINVNDVTNLSANTSVLIGFWYWTYEQYNLYLKQEGLLLEAQNAEKLNMLRQTGRK